MASDAKYKVGQRLWFVPSTRVAAPHWVEITKVGTKWLAVGIPEKPYWKVRLDIETLKTNRENSHEIGQCYLTQEGCNYHAMLCDVYADLFRGASLMPHEGVTINDIREAARLLKIKTR